MVEVYTMNALMHKAEEPLNKKNSVTFSDIQFRQQEDDFAEYVLLELVSEVVSMREELDYSQRELSKKSGVPQKTISRIENGIDLPKFQTVYKLLSALGLSVEVKVNKK